MSAALPHEILMADGSVHPCLDEDGGTKVFKPLANIDGRRWYCTECGVVVKQIGDVMREVSRVAIEESDDDNQEKDE